MTTAPRRVLEAWILLGLFLSGGLEGATKRSPYRPDERATKPRLATLPLKVRWSISSALSLAEERLRKQPLCQDLFTDLGSDGLERLATIQLRAASTDEELSLCAGRSAAAFTEMGTGRVSICPTLFSQLTREKAAVILIHEALHYAGLGEWPADPQGMRSLEITQLVRGSCGRGA